MQHAARIAEGGRPSTPLLVVIVSSARFKLPPAALEPFCNCQSWSNRFCNRQSQLLLHLPLKSSLAPRPPPGVLGWNTCCTTAHCLLSVIFWRWKTAGGDKWVL